MINLEAYFKDIGLAAQGRTLVALKHFPAGTVLLEQAPLTQVPLPSIRRQRCNYCLRRAALQCCGRCRSAYFCSNTCFRNAWLHYHHVLCEPLEYDTYTNVDADRWLLERAALTLHSHARLNKHNSHSPPHLKYAIQALELHPHPTESPTNVQSTVTTSTTAKRSSSSASVPVLSPPPPPSSSSKENGDQGHSNSSSQSDHPSCSVRLPTTTPGAITTSSPSVPIDYDAVSEMLEPFDCPFTPVELATVQEQISLSRFDILDPEQHMDKVGYGVYPLTTLYVQHSCLPNAGVVYRQDKQRLVTLEDIAPGELITISYVDLTLSRQARIDDLHLRFGSDFDCHCSRCQGELSCLDRLLEQGDIGGKSYLRLDQASTVLEEDIKAWNILDTVKQFTEEEADFSFSSQTRLHPSEFSHYVSRSAAPDIYLEGIDGVMARHLGVSTLESASNLTKDSRTDFTRATVRTIQSLLTCAAVPAFTVTMIRTAEVALRQFMDQQKWVEAAKCSTYLFVVYRLVYPPLHPVCSFHAIILAKTCWNSLVQLELAGIGNKLEKIYMHGIRTWIDVARDSVLCSFGQESSLWREIVDLQWVFERDQKLR